MERVFVEALAEVAAWTAAMEDDDAAKAWQRERRAAVVAWRRTTPHEQGHLTRVPLAAQPIPTLRGRLLADGEHDEFAERVGFDAEGRPVFHDDRGTVQHTWRYADDFTEETEWRGSPEVTRILHPGGGLPIGAVGAEGSPELLHQWVARWHRKGERLVRVERAEAGVTGWASGSAREATYDADAVAALHHSGWDEERELTDENRLEADEVVPALAAELERAAALPCPNLVWDGRIERPEPLRATTRGMADELARALAEAAGAASRAAGIVAPVCALLSSRDPEERLVLPPRLLVADERWRAGRRRHGRHAPDGLPRLFEGLDSGIVVDLDLLPHLDDEALQACRELTTLALDQRYGGGADALLGQLGDALTRAFNAPGPWPGAAALTVVGIGPLYHEEGPLDRARRVLGDAPVDAALASLSRDSDGSDAAGGPATAGAGGAGGRPEGAEAHADDVRSEATAARGEDAGTSVPAPDPDAARTDRRALEALLVSERLEAHAHRLAHDVATFGFASERPAAGDPIPTSRLGGPGVLGPGQEWPRTAEGRELALLAVIALDELDAERRPAAWPADGTLVFWGDVGEDEHGAPALLEPEPCGPGEPALVVYVPAGTTLRAAEPEGRPSAGPAIPVRWAATLTLPDGYAAADDLGLDPFEAEGYEAVVEALRESDPGFDGEGSGSDGGNGPRTDDAMPSDIVFGARLHADGSSGLAYVLGEGPKLEVLPPGGGAAGDRSPAGGDEEDPPPDAFGDGEDDEDDLAGEEFDDADAEEHGGGIPFSARVGGLTTGTQGHAPEPGTQLLLDVFGGEILGGSGNVQFRIPDDAVGDWDLSRVGIWPEF